MIADPTTKDSAGTLTEPLFQAKRDVTNIRRMTIVVAVSENGVIGRDQQLPWRLSCDLKRFKELTMGNVLLMGRKTFESIGKPLPGRTTIVLTRQKGFESLGVLVANSLEQALAIAPKDQHIFAVGGGEIYQLVLPTCDRMLVTRVHTVVEGDSYFEVPESGWVCVRSVPFPAGPKDDFSTVFEEWHLLPTK